MKTTRTTTADFIVHDIILGTVILTLLGVMSFPARGDSAVSVSVGPAFTRLGIPQGQLDTDMDHCRMKNGQSPSISTKDEWDADSASTEAMIQLQYLKPINEGTEMALGVHAIPGISFEGDTPDGKRHIEIRTDVIGLSASVRRHFLWNLQGELGVSYNRVMSDVDYWEVAGRNVDESHHSHTDNSVSLMGGFSYRVYGNSYARLVHFKSIGSKNTVGQDSVTSLQYEVRF